MFSENRQISKRQIRRLLIYDLFGIGTLLLPVFLTKFAGRDGIFCVLGAWLLLLCYLKFLEKMQRDVTQNYIIYLEQSVGKVVAKLFLMIYFVYCILFGAYALFTAASVIQRCLLREESFWLILFFLCLLAAYGVYAGMEGRARVYELLFWFLMFPLFLMLLFSMPQVNTEYWCPIFDTGSRDMAQGIYLAVIFCGVLFLVPFLFGFAKKKSQVVSAARQALAFFSCMNVTVILILMGIFNENALKKQHFPIITLMSMIDLPGGFLKRQDAFMVAIWFFTLYAFLNTGLFYSEYNLKAICFRSKKFLPLAICVLLMYGIAGKFYRESGAVFLYYKFLWYVGTPAVILIPVVAYLFAERRKENDRKK